MNDDTDIARIVLRICRAVLADSSLNGADDYFDPGGDSRGAVRMASAVFDELGVTVPIINVFLHPTPDEFADAGRSHLRARSALR